jgi:hypothetical protein
MLYPFTFLFGLISGYYIPDTPILHSCWLKNTFYFRTNQSRKDLGVESHSELVAGLMRGVMWGSAKLIFKFYLCTQMTSISGSQTWAKGVWDSLLGNMISSHNKEQKCGRRKTQWKESGTASAKWLLHPGISKWNEAQICEPGTKVFIHHLLSPLAVCYQCSMLASPCNQRKPKRNM